MLTIEKSDLEYLNDRANLLKNLAEWIATDDVACAFRGSVLYSYILWLKVSEIKILIELTRA